MKQYVKIYRLITQLSLATNLSVTALATLTIYNLEDQVCNSDGLRYSPVLYISSYIGLTAPDLLAPDYNKNPLLTNYLICLRCHNCNKRETGEILNSGGASCVCGKSDRLTLKQYR